MTVDFDQAWRDHQRHLLNIGLRMLSNLAEAEDVVQDAYARLARADLDEIDDVRGWLVVVTSRLCLDRLRARRRHPTDPHEGLGERLTDPALDPADRVTLDDNVRMALHFVLERLSPAERTAFVLHDVFGYTFEAIAEIVGRTPAACRQLASRARRTIHDEDSPRRFTVESAEQQRITERFMLAASTGNLDGLLELLDPEVVGIGHIGGAVGEIVTKGRAEVATGVLRFIGPDSGTTLVSVPAGDAGGIAALRDGRVAFFISFRMAGGRVDHIDAIVDRMKLAPLVTLLGKNP